MRFRVLLMIGALWLGQACGSEEKASKPDEQAVDQTENNAVITVDSTAGERIVAAGELKLGFIQIDSLVANYKGFQDVNKLLNEKASDLETRMRQADYSLRSRAEKLQKTYESGVFIERELMEKQQKLQDDNLYYQEKFSKEQQELGAEQARAQERQLKIIEDFIMDYAKDHEYDFIYSKPNGVLYGKRVYSVTRIVLEELNKQYEKGLAEDLEMEDVIKKDSVQ